MIATISEDGQTVTLRGKSHRDEFPSELLSSWLAFYRVAAAKDEGKRAHHYQPIVDALEAIS